MASRIASRHLTTTLRPPRAIPPSSLRPHLRLARTLHPAAHRFAHTIPRPPIPARTSSSPADTATSRKHLEPHYQLTFTCSPCKHRSTHIVSKQGYYKGSVLITCPSCRNRHVISDNLNIFGDRKVTVEDILREKGQLVKRGTLGEDGDIEFWPDDPTVSSSAGEPSAAPVEGQGKEDEARRLRETRDPSSHTTNTGPSASALPGHTGTRPSVQGVAHQNTTPSTRRQYHPFQPPMSLQARAGAVPVGKLMPPSSSKAKTGGAAEACPPQVCPSEACPSENKPILEPWQLKLKRRIERERGEKERRGYEAEQILQPRGDEMERYRDKVEKALQARRDEIIRRAAGRSEYQLFGCEPPHVRRTLPYEEIKSYEPEPEEEPIIRRVFIEPPFTSPRFVGTATPKKICVQLKDGVVVHRRPHGGEWVEKPPPSRFLRPGISALRRQLAGLPISG